MAVSTAFAERLSYPIGMDDDGVLFPVPSVKPKQDARPRFDAIAGEWRFDAPGEGFGKDIKKKQCKKGVFCVGKTGKGSCVSKARAKKGCNSTVPPEAGKTVAAIAAKVEPNNSEAKPANPPKAGRHTAYLDRADSFLADTDLSAFDRLQESHKELPTIEKKLKAVQTKVKQGDALSAEEKQSARQLLEKQRSLANDPAYQEAVQAMTEVRQRLLDESPISAKVAQDWANDLKFDASIPPKEQAKFRQVAAEYYRITGGQGADTIQRVERSNDRAFARPWENMVNVGKGVKAEIVFHEMAHHLEAADTDLGYAAIDWVKSRANTQPPKLKKLSAITGNQNYKDAEVAIEDQFLSPYVGKIYRDKNGKVRPTTEVVSMAVERFSDPKAMAKFYQEDPEHFKLVLGMLRKGRK